MTSDFGTDFIYGGLAGYFPFGGSAVWDQNPQYANNPQFAGAVDGVQRWYSIDGTIRSLYITADLAFNIRKIGLSIGLSGSAIRSNVSTIRARNSDGSDDVIVPDNMGGFRTAEGRSRIDVAGWQGGFGVGVIYDVLKLGKYFIGASYTSQPNVAGGMTLEGELQNALGLGEPQTTEVELTQSMPDIIRLGLRVRPTEKYELRLFGDFTRWSVLDRQCVLLKEVENRRCDFPGDPLGDPENFGGTESDDPATPDVDESAPTAGVTQHLPRYWRDAGGVRVGGSYWFHPRGRGLYRRGVRQQRRPHRDARPRADGHAQGERVARRAVADRQAVRAVLHGHRAVLFPHVDQGPKRAQSLRIADPPTQRGTASTGSSSSCSTSTRTSPSGSETVRAIPGN